MVDRINKMKERFEAQAKKLASLGFKGEVVLTGGIIMITTTNKLDSMVMRKAFKIAKNADTGTLSEFRFGSKSVFCWVDNALTYSKKELREKAALLVA